MSKNEDIKTTWISRYSLKFEGCRNWLRGGGEDGADNGSPYVQYRLCPTGSDRSCTTGCQGGNSFVVSMNHFIETYVESRESTCRKEREKCPCDANEHGVKKCLKKCMEEKDLDFCNTNEQKIDPKTFATCTELRPTRRNNVKNRNRNKVENEWEENKEEEKEEPDNDGNHLFVGPYCSGDGIYLRTFVDKDCTKLAKKGAYEKLNRGASLPYSNEPLVGEECMDCTPMDEPKERRALRDGVAPTCSKLYDISDKWVGDFLEGIDEPADENPATPCGNRRGCNDQDTSEESEPEPEPEEEEESEESELGSSGTESAEDPDKENESEESEGPEETSCRGSDCDDPGPDEPVTPEDPDQPEEPDEPCQGSDCDDPGSDQPETPEDPTTDPEQPEPEFPGVPVPPCPGRECGELPCRGPGCTPVLPVPVPEPCHGNPDCPQPVPPPQPPCDLRSNDCGIPEAPVNPAPEPGVPADPPVDRDGDLFPEEGGGDRALLSGGAGSWRAREVSHPGAGSNAYTSASALVVLLVVAAVALLARRVYGRGDGSKKQGSADRHYGGEVELEDGLIVAAGMTTDD